MSDYLAAAVTLLGLISLIIKYFLSDEAEKAVKEREIRVQEKKEQDAIHQEIDGQAALTEGANKAWDAADNED